MTSFVTQLCQSKYYLRQLDQALNQVQTRQAEYEDFVLSKPTWDDRFKCAVILMADFYIWTDLPSLTASLVWQLAVLIVIYLVLTGLQALIAYHFLNDRETQLYQEWQQSQQQYLQLLADYDDHLAYLPEDLRNCDGIVCLLRVCRTKEPNNSRQAIDLALQQVNSLA